MAAVRVAEHERAGHVALAGDGVGHADDLRRYGLDLGHQPYGGEAGLEVAEARVWAGAVGDGSRTYTRRTGTLRLV